MPRVSPPSNITLVTLLTAIVNPDPSVNALSLNLLNRRHRPTRPDLCQVRNPLFHRLGYSSPLLEDCGKVGISSIALGQVHYAEWG